MQTGDFVKSLFYPILLTGVIVFFSVLALHAFHHGGADAPFEAAMLDNTKLVLGALLGLVTGYVAGKAGDKTN